MRSFRNFVFFLVCLFLVFVNVQLLLNKLYSSAFYLVSLELIFFVVIILDVIYAFNTSQRLEKLVRENEKDKLAISDYTLESTLLSTLTENLETFGKDISLEEVLARVCSSVRNIFRKETVVLQLFGERFVRVVNGQEIEIPVATLEEIVLKGHPVLINNTEHFSQYAPFFRQGVRAFLMTPISVREHIIGVLGIFSFAQDRQFSVTDLRLLRMVAAPTALIIENAELFEKTKMLSITDGLTQLYNRRHFEEVLHLAMEESKTRNREISLAICDIDFFKAYNDANGHLAGDRVLRRVADILKKGVKGFDLVARYGGEEFVIIFPNTARENALRVCEELREQVADYKFPKEERQPNKNLTLSFGVASCPQDAGTAEELISKADWALYQAKKQGKNRVIAAG